MTLAAAPLVTPAQLTLLALMSAQADLHRDFEGACLRWELFPPVGTVIKSLTPSQIEAFANSAGSVGCVRFVRGASLEYWTDLARSLSHNDTAAVGLGVIASLMRSPVVEPVSVGG